MQDPLHAQSASKWVRQSWRGWCWVEIHQVPRADFLGKADKTNIAPKPNDCLKYAASDHITVAP